jgi:TonB family protein
MRPDGQVFQHCKSSVATNPQAQQPMTAAPQGGAAGTYALSAAPLMALTQDAKFLVTLKKVSEPGHAVKVSGSEIDFSAALMGQHAGVAVLDSAAVATPIEKLTTRLHAQFPDLVLIVAGTADEQGLLAAQITDGSVHRFLHKPVSEQRVRLFVEAAWRRHEEDLKDSRSPPPPPRPRRAQWGLIAAVALAVAAPLAWLALRSNGAPATATGTAAAVGDDAALEDLLARADRALAADQLVAPPQANAAALYREALHRNARDPRAAAGLEQVIDRLVTDAETQLNDHHLDSAQQLADAARAISPNHPRVAFLTAQIGAQRERAVLGRAQRAAAGGDVGAALAVLDDASRAGHSTLVDEARQQLAQKQVGERVAELVARTREALGSGALIEPAEQNAHFYIESARTLAPNDPLVQQARADVATRLMADARQALTAGNAVDVDRFASAAAESGADAGDTDALHAAAQQLRGAAKADQVVHTEALFNQRLAQGRLTEPGADSAKYYLEQLAQAEPASAATLAARTAFESRLLDEAHAAVAAQNLPAARRWLAEAQSAGASPAGIAAVEGEMTAAQKPPAADAAPLATATPAEAPAAAAPAPAPTAAAGAPAAALPATDTSFVNASSLTRTHYVPPEYPQAAREHGIGGWVDVQFTVQADGTLNEATVVGAQPAGVFEQSALDAVRHWRYQPLVKDGAPVAQRARVRVRFAVQS